MAEFDAISYSKASGNTRNLAELSNQGQIKGMVILTQAEYDALPATKETDGVIYLIRG